MEGRGRILASSQELTSGIMSVQNESPPGLLIPQHGVGRVITLTALPISTSNYPFFLKCDALAVRNLHVNECQLSFRENDCVNLTVTIKVLAKGPKGRALSIATSAMLPKSAPAKHIHQKLASHVPSFSDVFDEESFYIFAVLLLVGAIVAACVASRYVKIKDAGHID